MRVEKRSAAEAVAGVHVVAGGRVVDRLGLAPAVDAQLVGDAGEVLEVLAQVQPGVANLAEGERALHVVPLAGGHRRGEPVLAGELLQV